MTRMAARILVLAAALLAGTGAATASSLEVGPIRVQMIGQERTTTITLRNTGTTPVTVQLRTVNWSQTDGSDNYLPSSDLVASPPLAEIAPGEAQVVRLVVEHVDELSGERAYRLILDELPVESAAGGTGVRAALRALVPVFITPSLQSRPRLEWTAVRAGNQVRISARNSGDTRERLINSRVTAGGATLGTALQGYVLSGSTRTWILPAPPAGTNSLRIASEGEFGNVEADVPITS